MRQRRCRSIRGPSSAEGGSASVLVVAIAAVASAMTFAALQLAEVSVSRHRAAAAADLAAIAGAVVGPATPAAVCGRARRVASENGAVLAGCRLEGTSVLVRVDMPIGRVGGATVSARARAGTEPVAAPGMRPKGQPVPARAAKAISRAR